MAQHSEYREEFHGEHPYSYDHSEPSYSLIAILGGITVVSLFLVGIGIQGYYQRTHENIVYETVLSRDSIQFQELRNREQWELTHYGVEDKEKGVVRIPIEQAMKLIVENAKTGQLHYPTNPYPVRTAEDLATGAPPVSAAGAAAVEQRQNEGITSSPDVQQPSPQH